MTHTTKQSFLIHMAVLAGGCLLASALPGQTPTYFPLEVGNTWLYKSVSIRQGGGLDFAYQSVFVRSKEKIGDREYFDVSYFGREVALRVEPSTGDVLLYDRTAGAEVPWMPLSLPVGGTFSTSINPCPTSGQITARDSMVAVAVGDFPDVIEVKFQGNCVDVGVIKQYYAPNVGLIWDQETTIAGPVVYRLIYYHAGTSVGTPPEVSLTMAIDSGPYYTGTILGARLTLHNSSFAPANLHFPSGQSYDFQILNDKGDIAYTWSRDKTFAAIARDEKLGLGELTYGVTAPLDGLPPGRYIAKGYLTTDPITYVGQVSFEILALGSGIVLIPE